MSTHPTPAALAALVPRSEVARYLGYRGNTPDARVSALIETALAQLGEVATPGFTSRHCTLTPVPGGVAFDGWAQQSPRLATHLKNCNEAILMAATLGPGADRCLARAGRLDLPLAAVLQAAAAAMIECWCDECEKPLAAKAAARGLALRPRFSPGYADWPLTCQGELLRHLDAAHAIGLTATAGNMLAPTKSVTAVIGLAPLQGGTPCTAAHCAGCEKTDCEFRLR